MLTPPNLPVERILTHLRDAYAVDASTAEFLPLGADARTAVYRVRGEGGLDLFLKLRSGGFSPEPALLAKFFHDQGIQQVIDPHCTLGGSLWATLEGYTSVLYPFIEGQNGFEVLLNGAQRVAFGAALRAVHSLALPESLAGRIPAETYDPGWRERVLAYQARVEQGEFERASAGDPARRTARLIRARGETIRSLVSQAEAFAGVLRDGPAERVLCHADIHAGNLLITPGGAFYMVDWDTPIFAPRERDLMFIGAGVDANWPTEVERSQFFQGYGPVDLNLPALAYYRLERVVEDIAAFAEGILDGQLSPADQEQNYRWFAGQFRPGAVVDIAFETAREAGGPSRRGGERHFILRHHIRPSRLAGRAAHGRPAARDEVITLWAAGRFSRGGDGMEVGEAVRAAGCERFEVDPSSLRSLNGMEGAVYVCRRGARAHVLKFSRREEGDLERFDARIAFMRFLEGRGVGLAMPLPSKNGRLFEGVEAGGQRFGVTLTLLASGAHVVPRRPEWGERFFEDWGALVGRVHAAAADYPLWRREEAPDARDFRDWHEDWGTLTRWTGEPAVLRRFDEIHLDLERLPVRRDGYGLAHNDFHMHNFCYDRGGSTIIDFDSLGYHWFANDIGTALYHALVESLADTPAKRAVVARRFLPAFRRGYEREYVLSEVWWMQLPVFLRFRQAGLYLVLNQEWPEGRRAGWQSAVLNKMHAAVLSGRPVVPEQALEAAVG